MEGKGPDVLKRSLVVAVVTLSVLSGFFGLMLAISLLPEEEQGARIIVDQVFFHSKEVDQGKIDLEVYIYITNNGDESCDVMISAYALDVRTNLVNDTASLELGRVEGQSTSRGSLKVELDPTKQYRVDLVVQKGGMIAVKGSGTVNLREAGGGGVDYKTDYEADDDDGSRRFRFDAPESIAEEASASSILVILFIAPIIIIFTILIVYFIKKRRDGE